MCAVVVDFVGMEDPELMEKIRSRKKTVERRKHCIIDGGTNDVKHIKLALVHGREHNLMYGFENTIDETGSNGTPVAVTCAASGGR
jgi:hypothetical protein